MYILLVALIIGNASSLTYTDLYLEEEVTIDKEHNKFRFEVPAGWIILVYLSVENPDTLINAECIEANSGNIDKRNKDISIDPPGLTTVEGWDYKEDLICYYNITVLRKETGSILLYPFNKNINIDLTKRYGKMIPFFGPAFYEEFSQMKYFVSNAAKDCTFEFKYLTNIKTNNPYNAEADGLLNPFKICIEDDRDCKENITTFDFKKGKKYSIYIKLETKLTKTAKETVNFNILTGHSFYEKGSNSKFLRSSLFLLILLFCL